MKKTQRKDAVRNIRRRIVSYLSICLVIMLGLGGFFITRYMNAGIKAQANKYYGERSFKNYELISSLGISDDDLEQIKAVEEITDAEGVIRAAGSLRKGDLKRNVEIISRTERISVPELVEGKMPAAKDECAVGEDFAMISSLKVGDRVKLVMPGIETPDTSADGGKSRNPLLSEDFTITGLVKHPDYLRRKAVNTVVLPWDAYNMKATDGYYTHAFVKAEEPEGIDILDNKFFEETADQKQTLEELTDVLAVDSADRAKQKAYAKIDREWQKAQEELEASENEIDANEAALNDELADARKELADARKELDSKTADANKKISDGEKKINNAEKKIKAGEKQLKAAKKELASNEESYNSMKKIFDASVKDSDEILEKIDYLLEHYDEQDHENGVYTEEYLQTEKEVAAYLVENEETIVAYTAMANDPEVRKTVQKYDKENGTEYMKQIDALAESDIPGALIEANAVAAGTGHISKESLEKIKQSLSAFSDMEAEFDKKGEQLAAAKKELAKKEKELAAAKKELAAAKKQLQQSKKQLAAEKRKYEAQIRDGWSLYYSQKAEYENKLEEAKALLAENREEAEAKLQEARAEVDKITCKWLVFDRRANAGYVDVKSSIAGMNSSGLAFGLLFILISAIVCFSTLAIIIEEQKKMVGTVKAFGFHKGEILGKYLMFGVSAAVVGCIAGILIALGLSGFVLDRYNGAGMYLFGDAKSVITPLSTAAASIGMILVCALSTVIACTDILKSPASVLMKGGSSRSSSKRKAASGKGGSLYSRLILRNMLEDKVRVLISIAIIAFSTMLVGTGISMKLAYDGMAQKQVSDVYKYDIRVDVGDEVTDKQNAKLAKVLTESGAEYTRASYETHLYRWNDKLDALTVLTGDPEELGKFFAVKDIETDEDLALPDDGVLVQKRMMESYDMTTGSQIPVMDSGLDLKNAEVKGYFQNYVGRLMITSPEGYRKCFGEEPVYNCYYVKANGADITAIENDLLAVTENVSFEGNNEFSSKFEAISFLYNIIVYLSTGIAIMMSFMILTNLANIFLNRKKTELTVMRINGFSIKQTRGYLARETVVTTTIGVVLGVIMGAFLTPVIIRMIEQPDLQFVRTFHPAAWIVAVVLEVVFAIIINGLVFRKVKDLNLRDVT